MEEENLLFDELFIKTINLRRVQFVKLLQKQEIEIRNLKETIENLKCRLSEKLDDFTTIYLIGYEAGKESMKKGE